MSIGARNHTGDGPGPWWNGRLLAVWILVSAAAYVAVVDGGVVLELLASDTTRELAGDHRAVAMLLVVLIGAAFHGFAPGRWQWRLLVTRLPGLNPTVGDRHVRARVGALDVGQSARPSTPE